MEVEPILSTAEVWTDSVVRPQHDRLVVVLFDLLDLVHVHLDSAFVGLEEGRAHAADLVAVLAGSPVQVEGTIVDQEVVGRRRACCIRAQRQEHLGSHEVLREVQSACSAEEGSRTESMMAEAAVVDHAIGLEEEEEVVDLAEEVERTARLVSAVR